MRRFDLDLLHTLVTVADNGSLSAAAPRLCRSQSAISEQIQKLEAFCATPLFLRSKKGVALTPAGERLLNHARQILALSDHANQDMQGVALTGDLRLAITDYFRPSAIAQVLKRLRAHYPRLRLHVSIRKSAEIERDATGEAFDMGLSMRVCQADQERSAPPQGLRRIPLRRESLSWVASPGLHLDDDALLPLLVLPKTCSLQQFTTRTLENARVSYFLAHSASGLGGLQSALSAGLGVSCLNASAIPHDVLPFRQMTSLPALPDVEFAMVIREQSGLAAEAADLLAESLMT